MRWTGSKDVCLLSADRRAELPEHFHAESAIGNASKSGADPPPFPRRERQRHECSYGGQSYGHSLSMALAIVLSLRVKRSEFDGMASNSWCA
jgi:hypothetical protein